MKELTRVKRNSVKAWLDSSGLWRARVSIGIPAPCDSLSSESLRTLASREIKREIERERFKGKPWPLHLEVIENELGNDNRLYSITYAEKVL